MQIEIKILNKDFYRRDKLGGSYYETPQYQTFGSAAVDLVCTEDITIHPRETQMIPTGIAIWLGSHSDKLFKSYREHWTYAGLIIPRSGLGSKGLILANTIGLIDSDYQGELKVNVWNRNDHRPMNIKAGDRFAQLVIVPVAQTKWKIVDEFSNITDRNTGGFGSSGK